MPHALNPDAVNVRLVVYQARCSNLVVRANVLDRDHSGRVWGLRFRGLLKMFITAKGVRFSSSSSSSAPSLLLSQLICSCEHLGSVAAVPRPSPRKKGVSSHFGVAFFSSSSCLLRMLTMLGRTSVRQRLHPRQNRQRCSWIGTRTGRREKACMLFADLAKRNPAHRLSQGLRA